MSSPNPNTSPGDAKSAPAPVNPNKPVTPPRTGKNDPGPKRTNPPPTPPRGAYAPVNFSPAPVTPEAIANAQNLAAHMADLPVEEDMEPGPFASWQEFSFPVFIPLFIILLTLNGSAIRDIVSLDYRKQINEENAPALDSLKKSGRETEFLRSLQTGLEKLTPLDPIATQIDFDFFVQPPTQKTIFDPTSPPANNPPANSPSAKNPLAK